MAVLALLAGWLVAGRMLRPIRTITRTAQRISSTSLHERLALDGPQDELKELGDTLDDLFGRLEAAFEAQRQFVANASHELRTPLARQRALIQVALADPDASFSSLRAAHERVLVSEQHLEQMIDALLTLTRGQAGLERRERLDLEVLASQALLARESELAGRDLDVHATLATAPTAGDPRLLERLIANLIDNAIRHNTPGRTDRDHHRDPRPAAPSCPSRTPARPSRPKRSSVSSNPSSDSAAPVPGTTTDTDSDSRSSTPSPPRTAPRSAHARGRRADSRSTSHSRRWAPRAGRRRSPLPDVDARVSGPSHIDDGR